MKDSAGKFCPDKWTRHGEGGRVEGKDHEEVLHEDMKEEHTPQTTTDVDEQEPTSL